MYLHFAPCWCWLLIFICATCLKQSNICFLAMSQKWWFRSDWSHARYGFHIIASVFSVRWPLPSQHFTQMLAKKKEKGFYFLSSGRFVLLDQRCCLNLRKCTFTLSKRVAHISNGIFIIQQKNWKMKAELDVHSSFKIFIFKNNNLGKTFQTCTLSLLTQNGWNRRKNNLL